MKVTCDKIRRSRPLLGTFVEITIASWVSADMEIAVDAAFDTIAQIHQLMSFHDPQSDVARLNRAASVEAINVHPWTLQVLEAALELNRRSAGLFDIAVAPALQNMGLLPRCQSDPPSIPLEGSASEFIELLAGERVCFHHPSVRVDLGGIAKGFAVDRAIEVLRAHDIPAGLINAGGDIAAYGPSSHEIYIRDPRLPGRILNRVKLKNQALASSGGYFDPFQSLDLMGSTIIDPRTRGRATAVQGATVCAKSCMIADALTKVVMIAEEASVGLLKHYGANALIVSEDGSVRVTADWQDAIQCAA